MKVLELFAGTRSIGKAFEARGHQVFSVEWDKNFEDIDLYKDVLLVTPEEIIERFGRPDVIWASPDCTTYSIAAISHHRKRAGGGYKPGRRIGIRQVLRSREPSCSRPDHGPVADLVVHRESTRRNEENGLYVCPSALYRDILPIRRHQNEADRHLHQSPRPAIQTTLSQRGPMPYSGPARGEDRNARFEWKQRAVQNPAGAVRTHRPYMRNRGPVLDLLRPRKKGR